MAKHKGVRVDVNVAELAAGSNEAFWEGALAVVFAVLCRVVVEALEGEMDAFVGAAWHERNPEGRRTTRAGYRRRRFTVLGRDVMLRVPRARIAGFRSRFLGFRQRRHEAFDQAVVDLYVAGTSMRETTAVLWEMFGTSVSPTVVSRLVRELDTEREAFQSRRLSDDYLYLVFDAMMVRCLVAPARRLRGARWGESVDELAVLLVRGIKADGTRELVDFRVAPGERETEWEALLASLYRRGLEGKAAKLFIHDGSEGLENAIHSVYGPVPRQRCICHKLRNVWDAVRDKGAHGALRADASAVYQVATAEEAWERLGAFAERWREREPKAVATLCRDFETTLGFLEVPLEHRRWVSTTNPLERYIRELRRRTRGMGPFQGLASCRRLVYVAVKKVGAERRNAVPYSLWTSQPWYGSRRRSRRPGPAPDIAALRKELYRAFRRTPS